MTTNNQLQRNAFLKCGLLIMAMVTMLFSASAQSQAPAPPQPKLSGQSTDPNRIYDVVEILPSFPGGISAFGEYLKQNLKYPAADKEKKITGKVVAQFTVERDGSLKDIKVLRTPTAAMAASNQGFKLIA